MQNEHVSIETYNPHALITLRKINPESNDSMYILHKATDLESQLERIKNLEDFLSRSQGTIRQIIDKLSVEEWYATGVDKEDVLSELCQILDHEPKKEIRITGTLTFELRYDCPLEEVEDFDARYFAQDNLTLDTYHGDVIVESFDVEDADADW